MDLGRFELSLNVADLDASKKFYEILGFKVAGGNEAEGWLILTNNSLTIGIYQGHVPANAMNFRGRDVFAIAEELENCGLALEKPAETESDGSAGAWLKDPDGNLIYLNTAPGETAERRS
jgi:catechol 2,3-dioxygenase-like lactoylglutathione lyase family enzyme